MYISKYLIGARKCNSRQVFNEQGEIQVILIQKLYKPFKTCTVVFQFVLTVV